MTVLIKKFLYIIFTLFSFFSCSINLKTQNYELVVHESVNINYLIYMAADNNLERFAIRNIKSLQEIGSSKNTNIIVLFDRSPGYDKTEDNRIGTDLFFITKNPKKMNDDIIFEFDELDMTDSKNLYNFLKLINEYYPSEHIILNIWSHGRGLYPDGIIQRSIIEDYTTGYGALNTMQIYDMALCIKEFEEKTGKYIDIIQFDACDMQMLEIAYQLKDLTEYVVGSETPIPGNGSNYKEIAEYLNQNEFNIDDFSFF